MTAGIKRIYTVAEETGKRYSKKKVRINYGKAARALALLILVLTVVLSYLPVALGRGMTYDRSFIRPCGELGSKAPDIRAQSAIMYSRILISLSMRRMPTSAWSLTASPRYLRAIWRLRISIRT